MCDCVYVYVSICMSVQYAYTGVCMQVSKCMHAYLIIIVCAYICAYMMYVFVCIYVYIYVYVCVNVCITHTLVIVFMEGLFEASG